MTVKNRYLILLFAILLFDSIAIGLLLVVILQTLLSETNDASNFQNIIYATSFMIMLSPAYLISAPLLGTYSDHKGRAKAIRICLIVSVISYFMILIGLIYHDVFTLLMAVTLLGIGVSLVPIVQSAALDISQASQRIYHLSIITLAPITVSIWGYLGLNLVMQDQLSLVQITSISLSLSLINLCFFSRYLSEKFSPKQNFIKRRLSPEFYMKIFRGLCKPEVFSLLAAFCALEFSWAIYEHYEQHLLYVLGDELTFTARQTNSFIISKLILWIFGLGIAYCISKTSLPPLLYLVWSLSCYTISLLGFAFLPYDTIGLFWSLPINLAGELSFVLLLVVFTDKFNSRYRGLLLGILFSAGWGLTWAFGELVAQAIYTTFIRLPLYLADIPIVACLLWVQFLFFNSKRTVKQGHNNS